MLSTPRARRAPVALVVLAAAVLPTACGAPTPPATVALAVLADHAGHWSGRRVEVEGRMHGLDDPEHYWIEDDDLNRVAIEPGRAAAPHVGYRVRVVGRFRYARKDGRSIRAEQVQRLEP